ncbi:hypothetical protein GCM10010199_13920 [Dactylosporangium roseum]
MFNARRVLLPLAGAAAAVLALAMPAAAKGSPATETPQKGEISVATLCPSGWFCVWPQANFQGQWVGGKSRHTCYTPFSSGHSVSNQLGVRIRVYSKTGCTGSYFDLATGHYSNPTPFNVRSVATY